MSWKQKTNTILMNTEHGSIDLESGDISAFSLMETQSAKISANLSRYSKTQIEFGIKEDWSFLR